MSPAVVRKHVIISGRVQGVWYRQSTKEAAERIGGLTGTVRNLVDGRVEAYVQGAPEPVERLVSWCRDGPPAADVTEVVVADAAPLEGESGFRVVH